MQLKTSLRYLKDRWAFAIQLAAFESEYMTEEIQRPNGEALA